MGQDQSAAHTEATPEQLSQELALKFANQCYTPLEVFCFKEVFRELADAESGLRFWNEPTLCRYLELPDVIQAGAVLFQMATFLGSFPFWELAPCILTASNLLKAITIVTGRYKQILKDNVQDRYQLLYASIAVVDRRASEVFQREDIGLGVTDEEALEEALKGVSGFSITKESEEEKSGAVLDGTLARSAFEVLNIKSHAFPPLSDRPEVKLSIIPSDNLLRLVELLLYVTPMNPQTDLSTYSDHLTDESLASFRRSANTILASFGIEQRHGITYTAFRSVVTSSLPYMFDGLGALFEHFLFDKGFDLATRKPSKPSDDDIPTSPQSPESPHLPQFPQSPQSPKGNPTAPGNKGLPFSSPIPEPGDILNLVTLTQLSFFIPSSTMFNRLHYLFAGSKHGFSLGSLEKQVFTWRAPTILLVRGTLLPDTPSNSRERSFADSLAPKRLPSSTATSSNSGSKDRPRTVVYGAYISTPWKVSHKAHFGDTNTKLFQLSPVHDVFHASSISKDYASYLQPSPQNPHAGINLGSPLPATAGSKATSHTSMSGVVPLGPVSLYLDDSLEYGVFTHNAGGGGSFHPSESPARNQQQSFSPRSPSQGFEIGAASTATARRRSRGTSLVSSPTLPSSPPSFHRRTSSSSGVKSTSVGDWQDRFEIEALEVWGCGGDDEAEKQRRRIEGEERDARMRKEGIVGRTGDIDADREILRMAGLIGFGQQGGSV